MLHQLIPFVIKHWPLVAGFVIVLILSFIEEAKSQRAGGDKLMPALATHLMNREDAVVVDLRDANAFRDGHIVNAKNIAPADMDRIAEKLTAFRDRPIILVDAMGLKTAPAVMQLKKAGFEKVASLKGGIDAWKTASMPSSKENNMAKVEIYTKKTCSYCVRAKQLLDHKSVSYTEIKVDEDPKELEMMLLRAEGRRTVPQIFINDRGIGGCDDLYALEHAGKLDDLLK